MSRRSESESAPTPLRERIRETTAQAILAAAEEVFADQGLHAAHMGDIAAHAGVAVGTLYNHFKDREALLAGLLEARRHELLARLDAASRESADLPFRQRLRAILAVMLNHKHDHRKFFHILMQGEVGRYHETFPSAGSVSAETIREVFARVDKVMKQGVREGELRTDLADLLALVFMGIVRAFAIRAMALGADTNVASETDRLLGFFFEGAAA
jgi:AcrR family transcriptional regulator